MPAYNGIFLLNRAAFDDIYGPAQRAAIEQMVHIVAPPQTAASIGANPDLLAEVDLIFSGWGMAKMDAAFMAAAPRLKAVFYGAGSIKHCVTPAFWARDIPITSSYAANAVPVAEFTLAQILLSLKRAWQHVRLIQQRGKYVRLAMPGAYRSTVGLVSLGMIGRLVCEHLQRFDLEVLAYSPHLSPVQTAALGAEWCALDEIFRRSDVVSLHTPWLPETEGMITGELIASMKAGATLINTARGAIIRETEMIDVLQQRPDLLAILDVTYPEPPVPGSPLYSLPNVVLTPHIAGSLGAECQRMGQVVVEELTRFVRGEPLQWVISQEQAVLMA